MSIDEKNMDKFLERIKNSFDKKSVEKNLNFLKHIPLHENECIYVLDLSRNKIVYKRGLNNLLRYNEKEITFNFLLDNIHPEDTEITHRLVRAAVLHSIEHPENSNSNVLQISYRRKRNDNTYIKVLSNTSVFNVDSSGLCTCFLIKMTDISFLDKSNNVNWNFIADDLDKKIFNEKVYSIYKEIFTKREREIIAEIIKRDSNKVIADNLHISEHTVATHRKNILSKSNCHNVEELIVFCKGKGIIPVS